MSKVSLSEYLKEYYTYFDSLPNIMGKELEDNNKDSKKDTTDTSDVTNKDRSSGRGKLTKAERAENARAENIRKWIEISVSTNS